MIDTPLQSTKFERLECEYAEQHFLATKFKYPGASHTIQTRTHLLTLLRRGLLYPLTLVSAPAGFGKTMLLSQWIQSLTDEDASVAWVSLDESDNEPVRFWNVLLSALAQKLPVFGNPHMHEGVRSVSALLTLFINTCVVQQEPIVFVLDDYHAITDSAVQEQMTYFIEHLPPHVHVVLSTRVDPCLPLARLRVRQHLLEVRTNALRFTHEEAMHFFNEVMHLSLTAAEVMYLVEHMDGWVAGLRLAGCALYETSTGERVSVAARGDQRYILDYILEEVLAQQEEHIQAFLVKTAHLSRFSASLCDAVLGRHDSWKLLRQIERANLFLVAEDDKHEWYHYQEVFVEALHSCLEPNESEIMSMLHRRASQWYEQHGLLVEALEQLCVVQDWEQAINIIERVLQQHTGNAQIVPPTVLQNLLVRLPEHLMQTRPQLRDLIGLLKSKERKILASAVPQEQDVCEKSQVRQVSPSQQLLDPLSTRELEVLQLMAQGASNDDIGDDLVIAIGTVKRHVSNVLSKLQAANRTQAVAYARHLGLLS